MDKSMDKLWVNLWISCGEVALLTKSAPPFVSPYVERAALRAKRLERELRSGDRALEHDDSPSTQDKEAADSSSEASIIKLH